MRTSEDINELATALAKAQASIGAAKKDATNPHFRSQYATLASAWAAWQEVGPQNGLAVVQSVGSEDGASIVTTRLCHSSGQWMESEIRLRLQKDDMQGMGSAITYARRYSLMAMAGIAPADDDDGNAAVQSGVKPATKKPAQLKREDAWPTVAAKIDAAVDEVHLKVIMQNLKDDVADWPEKRKVELREYCDKKRSELQIKDQLGETQKEAV